jgi:hypothetical protein
MINYQLAIINEKRKTQGIADESMPTFRIAMMFSIERCHRAIL